MGIDILILLNWMTIGLVAGIAGVWANKLHANPLAMALAICFGPVFVVIWVGEWWESKRMACQRKGHALIHLQVKKAEGFRENTRSPSA